MFGNNIYNIQQYSIILQNIILPLIFKTHKIQINVEISVSINIGTRYTINSRSLQAYELIIIYVMKWFCKKKLIIRFLRNNLNLHFLHLNHHHIALFYHNGPSIDSIGPQNYINNSSYFDTYHYKEWCSQNIFHCRHDDPY